MMATITGLRGKYNKLNNQERLRLVADAIARDDSVDLSALIVTAPKQTYTMAEAWLEDRFNALWRISVIFSLAIEMLDTERLSFEHKHTIAMLLGNNCLKPEFLSVVPDAFDAPLLLKGIDQRLKNNFVRLQSAVEAINQLAQDVGLSPEELISHAPADVRERLETVTDNNPKKELPEEYVNWYYDLFAYYWPGLPQGGEK